MLVVMLAGLLLVLTRREFLPWYWVWIVPFVALLPNIPKLIRFSTIVSLGLLLSYAPYMYFGDYGAVSQELKMIAIWGGVTLAILSFFLPVSEWQDPKRSGPER